MLIFVKMLTGNTLTLDVDLKGQDPERQGQDPGQRPDPDSVLLAQSVGDIPL